MRLTVRFVGDPVPQDTQDRIRAAVHATLGDVFDAGAFVELRHRDGGFGMLAYSEPVGSGSVLGLRDRVEDALRGLEFVIL